MRTFANFHPAVLLVYFIGVMGITMFSMNPLLLAVSMAGAICFAVQLENGRAMAASMGFYIPMFLMIAAVNPLFSHNGITPLFYMNDQPVTLEAILYGAAIGGMLISVLYWCRCYNFVMTSDKFIYLFGKAVPKLSLIISMALRFVPLFIYQIRQIHGVQKTMGIYATKSVTDRLFSGLRIFSAMITWSLENAVDTAASMKARGYGIPGRSNYSLFRFRRRDGILLAGLLVLFAVVIYGAMEGVLDFAFYPRISSISMTPLYVITFIALILLMFIPFVVEIEENKRWNYYRSKI